jgi:hypothetical protein
MSSVVQTGNLAHDNTCANSLRTLQASIAAAGGSQSVINVAYVTHFRNVAKSAVLNGCGAEPALVALRSLGVGIY